MDKFAIDLDKVLDDFEINEDREERLAAGKVPYRQSTAPSKPSPAPSAVLPTESQSPVFLHATCHQDQQFSSQSETGGSPEDRESWSSPKTAEAICGDQTNEDGKPDLLGTVKPQQCQSQQYGSEEMADMDIEDSLPDVTVLSHPSPSRVPDLRPTVTPVQSEPRVEECLSEHPCDIEEDPYTPPIIEYPISPPPYQAYNLENPNFDPYETVSQFSFNPNPTSSLPANSSSFSAVMARNGQFLQTQPESQDNILDTEPFPGSIQSQLSKRPSMNNTHSFDTTQKNNIETLLDVNNALTKNLAEVQDNESNRSQKSSTSSPKPQQSDVYILKVPNANANFKDNKTEENRDNIFSPPEMYLPQSRTELSEEDPELLPSAEILSKSVAVQSVAESFPESTEELSQAIVADTEAIDNVTRNLSSPTKTTVSEPQGNVPKPVGFTAAEELSDSELERMLNELEDDEYLEKSQETEETSSLLVIMEKQEDSVQEDGNASNFESTFQDNLCLTSTSDQVYCEDGMQEISQARLAPALELQSELSLQPSSRREDGQDTSVSSQRLQDFLQDRPLECLEKPRPKHKKSRQASREASAVQEVNEPLNEEPGAGISTQEVAAANEGQEISDEELTEQLTTETAEDEEGKPHRPSSLQLSNEDTIPYPPGSTVTVGPPGNTPGTNVPAASGIRYTIPDEIPTPAEGYEASPSASSSSSSSSGAEEACALEESRPASLLQSLGVVPPYWVPDAEAPVCMHCEAKFTVIKRRHHCRACGKVLCSRCCGHKARLQYLENTEARVCQSCFPILCAAQDDDSGSNNNSPQRLGRSPNPNNPMEYCSTIPPLQQAGGSRNQRPPSVMVPVGVLKREGSSRNRGEPKQVMFSDGIRPGGDLTELDGWAESRLPRRQGRQARRVGTPPGPLPSPATSACTSTVQGLRLPEIPECRPRSLDLRSQSNASGGGTGGTALVPSDLASYTLLADSRPGAFSFELSADMSNLMDTLRNESEPPVVFALNKNLFVLVKIITLSCCVHKTVWCFTTRGLRCEGQDEMVFILEALPEEKSVPRDVFAHISAVFLEAGKGNTVTELGHTTFHGPFLGSSEHGGFLYIRPTSQCLQRLILPPPPYLVAVLLQRWEAPWARLFPLRLLLRLGYEFRYYPCPLVSVRERRPVYCELGQTILDLLADFRNFTYTLPCIQGLVIHMEDRQTSLLIPKNRYDQVVRVLNNSNDHVLALGGSFSRDADSHLVCVQSDDETYHSKAISILNRPRKVTGASFLVFNGALKSSSGLSAKSSIVEDGLMVQVPADTMTALRTALRDMKDFSVGCGPASVLPPAETVLVSWVDDDRHFNVGVRSQIDGSKLDGVPSIRVHNGTDYRGENCFIRWTEVFLLKCEEGGGGRLGSELDISRVSESIARAFCVALVPLLDLLAAAGLLILAVRATLDPDNVGYEAGSSGEKLPPLYMRSLDDELVPVIHQAASQSGEGKTVLELVFSVMRH